MQIEDMYSDVVKYAKALENLLLSNTMMDDYTLSAIRQQYIKPATNVAKAWTGVEK